MQLQPSSAIGFDNRYRAGGLSSARRWGRCDGGCNRASAPINTNSADVWALDIVAFILLLSGIFHIAGGLMIAAGWLAPEQAALAVFFPRRATTGAVIDRAYICGPLKHRTWYSDGD
jgi:hypothetical protein